jgi:hypothetical protein
MAMKKTSGGDSPLRQDAGKSFWTLPILGRRRRRIAMCFWKSDGVFRFFPSGGLYRQRGSVRSGPGGPHHRATWPGAGQVRGHVARHGTWVGTGRMDVSKKRLVLVCGASLEILKSCQGNRPAHGVVGVLHLVSEATLAVTRACAGQVRTCGPSWHMGRHWTHGRVQEGTFLDWG